eukprot:TRINITY_DN9556_c0_g1_i3.p1 TRINITY_DN9556_c0_g1~~TRINITY_DN9556_c0_g1_i3.p1  ORF type:complete len:180 (+),score=40.97 TRINITY_DN9556_c0_g1_i3:139-678(+)
MAECGPLFYSVKESYKSRMVGPCPYSVMFGSNIYILRSTLHITRVEASRARTTNPLPMIIVCLFLVFWILKKPMIALMNQGIHEDPLCFFKENEMEAQSQAICQSPIAARSPLFIYQERRKAEKEKQKAMQEEMDEEMKRKKEDEEQKSLLRKTPRQQISTPGFRDTSTPRRTPSRFGL